VKLSSDSIIIGGFDVLRFCCQLLFGFVGKKDVDGNGFFTGDS
jgi:hypothetical protein